nr:uncharacterized protein LOC127482582 isoform X5 [Oryctolagus cuniculus]
MRLWFTHRNTCTIRNINTSVNTLQHYPITVKQKAGLITPSLWTFWSVTWLSSESAFVLLRLLEFSELPRFLLPLCYCVDQIIPGHKNTPGSDSPGVQVMSVGFPSSLQTRGNKRVPSSLCNRRAASESTGRSVQRARPALQPEKEAASRGGCRNRRDALLQCPMPPPSALPQCTSRERGPGENRPHFCTSAG